MALKSRGQKRGKDSFGQDANEKGRAKKKTKDPSINGTTRQREVWGEGNEVILVKNGEETQALSRELVIPLISTWGGTEPGGAGRSSRQDGDRKITGKKGEFNI